jgi:hypothetical protein
MEDLILGDAAPAARMPPSARIGGAVRGVEDDDVVMVAPRRVPILSSAAAVLSRAAAAAAVSSSAATPTAAAAKPAVDATEPHFCSICLGNGTEPVELMPCRHLFCKECIYGWMDAGDGDNNRACPYCRGPVDSMIKVF